MRKPAASPTTSTPSVDSWGIIPAPSSGTRWALYSTTFPPWRRRWTAGCIRNFVWRSWTSIFFRDKSSTETTSPMDTDALFVYRKPPPRRPIDAWPAYTKAAPSFSPRPNRSWIVSGGSSTVSLIPTETSRGSKSAFKPAFRTKVDGAPSAITTRSDATRSFGATETPRTRPPSRQRSSTRIPVTRIAPASWGEPRGIERDGERGVLGQEGEILADDEPLDRAVLRPLRNEIGERPCVDAPTEHPFHARSPSALHQEGRKTLPGKAQRGGRAGGPGPDYDGVKTLHVLPGPAVEKRDG